MSNVEVINTSPNSDVPRDATEFGQQEGQPQEQVPQEQVPQGEALVAVPQPVQHQEVQPQYRFSHSVVAERTVRMANKRDFDYSRLYIGTYVVVGANCDTAEYQYQVHASYEETLAARAEARTKATETRFLQKYTKQGQKVQRIVDSERGKTRAMAAMGAASEAAARHIKEAEAQQFVLNAYENVIANFDEQLAAIDHVVAENQAVVQNSDFLRRFLKDKKDKTKVKSAKARKSTRIHVGRVVHHSHQE